MSRLIRIDRKEQTAAFEPLTTDIVRLGGRALTSHLLYREVDPGCDPLGAGNKLILAPGVLSGTTAPCSGRISVGAKSPLTGGIKESNIRKVADAGADTFVAGSAIFGKQDYKAVIDQMRAELA